MPLVAGDSSKQPGLVPKFFVKCWMMCACSCYGIVREIYSRVGSIRLEPLFLGEERRGKKNRGDQRKIDAWLDSLKQISKKKKPIQKLRKM